MATRPTWQQLREAFSQLAPQQMSDPLEEDGRELVRGLRYSGRRRILRRLELGLVTSLEVEDASPVSAALAELERWSQRLLEKEEARALVRRSHSIGKLGQVPRWVERSMGARLERAWSAHDRYVTASRCCWASPAHTVCCPLS